MPAQQQAVVCVAEAAGFGTRETRGSYHRIQLTVSSREVLHATDKTFSRAVNRENTELFTCEE